MADITQNISINYGNDYFDWDMDRPLQVAAIKRDVEARRALGAGMPTGKQGDCEDGPVHDVSRAGEAELEEKIMGGNSRIIHDGTFLRWTALAISAIVQLLVVIMVLYSRYLDPSVNPSSKSLHTSPFKGFPLWIAIVSTFFSQEYIAPPLRLHYNGFGEVISSFLLSPVSFLWGLAGHYTATHPTSPLITAYAFLHAPSIAGFGIDKTLWIMLCAMYLTVQARILIMHIHDIDSDRLGGKVTRIVRVGFVNAARLYASLNVGAVAMWGWLIKRLLQGEGAMLGSVGTSGSKAMVGRGWAVSVGFVLAYSIPVIVLTSLSLFSNTPNRSKSTGATTGFIPLIPPRDLAKVVSLQLLVTPVVLSTAVILAGAET